MSCELSLISMLYMKIGGDFSSSQASCQEGGLAGRRNPELVGSWVILMSYIPEFWTSSGYTEKSPSDYTFMISVPFSLYTWNAHLIPHRPL